MTRFRLFVSKLLIVCLTVQPPMLFAQSSNDPDILGGILSAMSFKSILDGLKTGNQANLPNQGTLKVSQPDLDAYRALNGGEVNAKGVQARAFAQQDLSKSQTASTDDPQTWLYKSANRGKADRAFGTDLSKQASARANSISKGINPPSTALNLAQWFSGCISTPDGRGGVTEKCAGPVRCMGGDCFKPAGERNTDFNEVATASQFVQSMRDGMACAETGVAPRDNFGCTPKTIFKTVIIDAVLNITEQVKQDVCSESGQPLTLSCNGVDTELVGTIADMPTNYPGCTIKNLRTPDNSYPENCTPRLFMGRTMECNTYTASAVGLANDCCAEGVKVGSNTNYIQAAQAIYNNASIKSYVGSITGQYTAPIKEFMAPLWDNAKQTVGNLIGTGSGAAGTTGATSFGLSTDTAAALQDAIKSIGDATGGVFTSVVDSVKEFASGVLQDTLSATVGSTATQQAMNESMSQAIETFNVVMSYYAIASFVGKLLTQCKSEEIQMGIEVAARKCVVMNKYCAKRVLGVCVTKRTKSCCYNSMVSRIMGQQIKKQLNPAADNNGYGSAESPNCDGFEPDALAQVNWEAIDLSEWFKVMKDGGFGIAQTEEDADRMMSPTANQVESKFGFSPPNQPVVDRVDTQVTKHAPLTQADNLEKVRATSYESEQLCYQTEDTIPSYAKTPIPVTPEDVLVPAGGGGNQNGGSIRSCGANCIELVLGREGIAYINDTCTTTYNQFYDVLIKRPDLITSARIVSGNWDDHLRVQIDGADMMVTPGFYPSIANPTKAGCELSTNWIMFQNYIPPEANRAGFIDVTNKFKVAGYVRTNTAVRVWGRGNGYVILRITYDPVPPVPTDVGRCLAPAAPK